MKQSQRLALVLLVIGLTALGGAATASATTLETNGVKQTGAVTIEATLSGSTVLKDTSNSFLDTCTVSTLKATTSVFTGTLISGPISTLSYSKCTHEPAVVDQAGSLSIERVAGTTNGTVRSTGAKWTLPVTIFGSVITATCATSATDIGTLTGVASGNATLDLNGVLNCGSIIPSARWEGKYLVTGQPLGVTE
jgi:hypothetical protein